MRIHRLELHALGPFADREVIDFDTLGSGILLVNGPTGSGKSSLLDAIAYALFGDVPGARKSLKSSLHSHHAPPGREPFVELIFSVGPQRWKISRTPEWDAPKKRVRAGASETRKRQASVLLSRWRDDAWHAESTRLDEAGQVINDILGMGLAQFAQVIVLPQGEFAAFLRAKQDDRRALLERLFDVERFDRVEQWFLERKGASARARSESSATLENYVAIVTESVTSLGDPSLIAPGHPDGDEDELRDDLAQLVSSVEIEHARRLELYQIATAAAERARNALTSASHIRKDQAAWTTAQTDDDNWSSERVATLHAKLDRAQSANIVVAIQHRADRAEALWRETHQNADTAMKELGSALADSQLDAQALLTKTPLSVSEERELFERALREKQDVESAEQAHDAAEQGLIRAQDEQARATRDVEVAEREREIATKAEHALQRRLDDTPDSSENLRKIETLLSDLSTRAPQLHNDVDSAQAAFTRAAQEFADAETHALQLRARRLEGIAGELAHHLIPQNPCPVCGSCEHPDPAPLAPDTPSDDDIQAAERTARRHNELRLKAGSHNATQNEALAGFIEEIQRRLADIQDAQVQGLNAQALVRASWEHTDLHDITTLQDARQRHVDAVAAHLSLKDELDSASEITKAAAQQHQDATMAQTRSAAQCESAHDILVDARKALDDARLVWQESQQALATAAILPWSEGLRSVADTIAVYRRIETAQREAMRTQEMAQLREENRQEAQRERDLALTQSPFKSLDEVEAAILNDANIAELQTQWRTGMQIRVRVEQTLADPDIQVAAFTPEPNLDSLGQAVTRTEETVQAAAADEAQWGNAQVSLLRMQARIHDELATYEKLNSQTATMGALADAFAGNGDNERKMRLTSYVLAAHLETVTTFANHRLTRMSGGRYQLHHTDERASHGRKSGLGLEVVDAWTGRARDTATLSGGEAFMASLALALGLGDAVLAESGGMKLDTLFIDEGFGSLDQETLEEVMTVLDELREGGRLVGIISHVSELRARIPTRIDVVKEPEGSHIRIPDTVVAGDA